MADTVIARQVMAQQAMADLNPTISEYDQFYAMALDFTLQEETPMYWPIWMWPPLLQCENSKYWRGVAVKYNVIKP